MTILDAYVRAKVDKGTKERASAVLAGMGLTISDAIRLMLVQVIKERRLPFEIKTPNNKTLQSIDELEQGKGKAFNSKDDLLQDLGI